MWMWLPLLRVEWGLHPLCLGVMCPGCGGMLTERLLLFMCTRFRGAMLPAGYVYPG